MMHQIYKNTTAIHAPKFLRELMALVFSIFGLSYTYTKEINTDSLQSSIVYVSKGTTITNLEYIYAEGIHFKSKSVLHKKQKVKKLLAVRKPFKQIKKNTLKLNPADLKGISEVWFQPIKQYLTKSKVHIFLTVSTDNNSFPKFIVLVSNRNDAKVIIDSKKLNNCFTTREGISNSLISTFSIRPPPENLSEI